MCLVAQVLLYHLDSIWCQFPREPFEQLSTTQFTRVKVNVFYKFHEELENSWYLRATLMPKAFGTFYKYEMIRKARLLLPGS